MDRAARAQARLEAAHIALAATRYHLENGKLPTKPDELVPAFLDEIPIDPFDGQPMRYKPTADGAVVYSVGPNRVDDGGIEKKEGVIDTNPLDIVFHLKAKAGPSASNSLS